MKPTASKPFNQAKAKNDRQKRFEGSTTLFPGVKTSVFPRSVNIEHIRATLTTLVNQREKEAKEATKGPISSYQPVTVMRNDAPTTLHAIKKRLDVVPVDGVGEDFKAGWSFLMDITPQGLPPIVADRALIDAWRATLEPEKQAAIDEVLAGHLHWQGMHDREVFAKPETLLKGDGAAARLIHNGNPMVNLVMGAITNELQSRAKQVLSERNPAQKDPSGLRAFFPCGLNDKAVAELRTRVSEGDGRWIECDFKSNDATQPGDVRKYEAQWYRKLGAPDWYAAECLEQQSMNVFSRQLGVKFSIKGQRHSGEEAGTIGNTFNAACIYAGALISIKTVGVRLLVYGDDSLMWLPNKASQPAVGYTVKALEASVANHGMELEISTPMPEHATFLQTYVYDDHAAGAVPVPKLGRYLSKLNVRANSNPDVSDKDYMAGKYLALAHQTRYLPSVSGRLLKTSQRMSSTPRLRDWTPLSKRDPTAMVEETISVHRPLSAESEADALYRIYHLELPEILSVVDQACVGALMAVQDVAVTTPELRHLFVQHMKATGGKAVDDLDGPAMATMVLVDNKDSRSV